MSTEEGMFRTKPLAEHEAFRLDLIQVMRKHGDKMTAIELLAVAAFFVGQLIAFQDRRKWTSPQVMRVVASNIKNGNQNAIEHTFPDPQGRA